MSILYPLDLIRQKQQGACLSSLSQLLVMPWAQLRPKGQLMTRLPPPKRGGYGGRSTRVYERLRRR